MAYDVPGMKVVLSQPNTMACWATVYAMMLSWKRQQSFDIAPAVETVGATYLTIFQNNTGLPSAQFGSFLVAAGMQRQPMINLPIASWEALLRRYGLLWVGALNTIGAGAGLHSRIVEGIAGNGTAAGSSMKIIDPAGGRRYVETFPVFTAKYEGAIRITGGEYYQIRHFA